ncbi:MAG TPA: BON domain-containing protein [Candidatus Limnocylindria bacterium]|nr:BON domain-containing protein [Candidatus Limnocylindria bacterium]
MQVRALVLALVCVLAASGCSLAGRTFGRYVDDQAITAAVKIRLAAKQPSTVARINVDTYDGVVYLSGRSESEEQKATAESAARRVDGVAQVVNDLRVPGEPMTAASPRMDDHALLEQVPGIARIDGGLPGAPAAAYDGSGRLVATIYTVTMRELAQQGFNGMRPTAQPIDHVAIFPVAIAADRPEPEYHVVLWHVSATEAAALR